MSVSQNMKRGCLCIRSKSRQRQGQRRSDLTTTTVQAKPSETYPEHRDRKVNNFFGAQFS